MNHLALYQLSDQYWQALDFLTDPQQDIPAEAINDTLESLSGELQDKAINVAKFLRNMETSAENIKAAEQELARRRKMLENRADWLRAYLKTGMERTGLSKIECPYFQLAIQKNPDSVSIIDENAIPESFKEQVITWKIDKTAIKNAIKSGQAVAGATLINGTRLVIK